ncbi:MAG: PAS domain S-box protein [Planctomycetaceae bacterium]|nr:PAS domain S-box protein [Planctomycetaceae bacterium]
MLQLLATVFVAELVVMLVLPSVLPAEAPPALAGLVDALLLSGAVALVSLPLANAANRCAKVVEQELRQRTEESEHARRELEIYRRAIEHHALVAITDEAGRVLQANAKLCEALGLPRERVLGSEGLVLGCGLHPREFWDAMEARIRANEVWQAEIKELGPDGQLHHRLTTVVPFEAEGALRRIVVQSDVSEARNAAAHFREMAQRLEKISSQLPGVVYQFRLRHDGSSHFPYASEGIRQIYGLAPADVREDATPVFGVLHPEDLDRVRARILESARDLTQWRDEYRVVHADGRVRWVMGSSVPEREHDGAVLWHGFITDITERRLEQEALERAKETAERAARVKSEFLAAMSHEIRTPMNGVLGFTNLLLDTPLDEEQTEFVRTIEGSGHALLSILDDVLDLSKIEAGALTLERTDFEPRRAVEEVGVLLASRAQERGLELVTSVSPEVPECVRGDPGRVRQVLLNLVGNAVKFTERGGVTVRIGGQPPAEMEIEVADTGIGRVEDLLGKKVALVQFTPSHWMLDYAIDNSALLAPQKKALRNNLVFVGADEGTPGVRAMFESGAVQAAVLWDPDASLALRKPGAHVVFSTSTATSLVYDGIVCDSRVVAQHPEVVQRLVAGWFEGVGLAEADAGKAIDALTATEPSFADLEKKEGREFIAGLFKSIKWTDLDDNVRILGLNTGDGGDFARVYSEAGKVWRANGGIADPSVPPIPPMAAVDTRFVEALVAKKPEAKAEAAKPEFTFDPKERQAVVTPKAAPVLTKPVAVFFASGSGKLDRNAQRILDDQVAPLVQSMGNAYISVEGNTDVKGSAATNRRLSQERAQAVVDYLVANYAFDRARFNVAGNGPDKPVCSEPGEECLERNRRTDVAVYAR